MWPEASWVSPHDTGPGVISQVVSSPHYCPPQAAQGQLLQPSPSHLSPRSLIVPIALPPFRMAPNYGQAQQPTPTHTWSAQAYHEYSGHMCLSQLTPSSLCAPHAFPTSSPHLKVSLCEGVGVLSTSLDCGHHEGRFFWDSRYSHGTAGVFPGWRSTGQ